MSTQLPDDDEDEDDVAMVALLPSEVVAAVEEAATAERTKGRNANLIIVVCSFFGWICRSR
jgi:hypothetical protein